MATWLVRRDFQGLRLRKKRTLHAQLIPRNGPQHGCEGRSCPRGLAAFAPQASAACANPRQSATEDLNRRRRLTPTTVPDDPASIAQTTDGERLIADRNPRAAEAAFKIPGQYPTRFARGNGLGWSRCWITTVRARRKFSAALPLGEHAATQEPMVTGMVYVIWQEFWNDEVNWSSPKI